MAVFLSTVFNVFRKSFHEVFSDRPQHAFCGRLKNMPKHDLDLGIMYNALDDRTALTHTCIIIAIKTGDCEKFLGRWKGMIKTIQIISF